MSNVHAMLKKADDWVEPGNTDEQKPALEHNAKNNRMRAT